MPCLTGGQLGQLNCFFANMTSCSGISTLRVEGEGVGKTVAPTTNLLPEVVKLTGPSVGGVQLPNNVGDGVEGKKRVPLQSVIVTGIIEIIVEVTEAGTVVVGCNIVLHKLDIPGISTNPEKHGHSQPSSARTLAAMERSRKVGDNFIFNSLQRICQIAKFVGNEAEDDGQYSSVYNLYIYGHPLSTTASWESYAEL